MPASYGGASGGSLPATPAEALLDAGNAQKLVYLDGSGVGDAASFADASETGMTDLISTLAGGTAAEGNFLVADGAGGLQLASVDTAAVRVALGLGALATASTVTASQISDSTAAGRTLITAVDAAAQRSALGVSGVTMLYASDCFAEAGSESASISGSGSSSTFTLTASSTSRTYGTAGATAARVVCPIPAGTREIEVELQTTAVSGMTTGGFRYLTMALRNARDGAAPTVLWGVSVNDSGSGGLYASNLMGGANTGAFNTSMSAAPTAADRWYRAVLKPREIFLSASSGSGSAGARPTTWAAPATAIPLQTSGSSVVVPDLGSATALAIVLQSFGTGGATSITARVAIRVVPQ